MDARDDVLDRIAKCQEQALALVTELVRRPSNRA
jgi:hypothetical protein